MNKRITLTFDNGPHPVGTPDVLDVLSRRGLKATFFLVCEKLLDPELHRLAERIQSEGHRIANHTMTHSVALGRTYGNDVVLYEVGQAQELLEPFDAEKLFRPNGEKGKLGPHLLSEAAVDYLEREKFTAVSWNCVPMDWVGPDGAWLERANSIMQTQDWTALVLHDHCQAGLVHYLESYLDALLEQDFEFRFDFPKDVVLIEHGRRMPALEGLFTPRAHPVGSPN